MIDIHCHILPGIDDGPEDIEESLEMARIAAEEGTRIIVATPHFYVGLYTPDKATIRHKTKQLNELLQARDIGLRVLPGMEIALTPEVVSHFDDDALLGLNNTSYLLVEPSRLSTPVTIHKACHQLLVRNTTPILAHPERVPLLQSNPEVLLDLVKSGLLLQINAANLDLLASRKAYDCASFLLEHRAVHCIASDGHSIESRPPRLYEAVEEAGYILDSRKEALSLVTSIPKRLITGAKFTAPDPLPPDQPEPAWKRFIPFIH